MGVVSPRVKLNRCFIGRARIGCTHLKDDQPGRQSTGQKKKIPPSKKEVAQSEGIQCNNSAQSARFNTGANSASVSLSFIQKPGITCLTHHQVLSEIRYKTHNVFIRSATQFQTC